MFVSGSQDKTVRFWDLRTRGCVNMVTPATAPGSRVGVIQTEYAALLHSSSSVCAKYCYVRPGLNICNPVSNTAVAVHNIYADKNKISILCTQFVCFL